MQADKNSYQHQISVATLGGDRSVYTSEIIPLPIFPKLGYKLVPRGKNWSYGVAALIFAAIEYRKTLKSGF